MKIKLLSVLSIVVTAALALSCAAFADLSAPETAVSTCESLISYQLGNAGASTVQEWIDGELTKKAGNGSEWFVMTLARSENYDFTGYLTALEKYLSENNISSATSREKYALTMIAAGHDSPYINKTADDSIGAQGIMSMIYGLHLLNNGAVCEKYTADKFVDELLGLQYDDGGWALMGEHGDIDVTAMTVQALAPHKDKSKAVSDAIDRAVDFMSQKQLEDGDYQSFGVKNPESAAQVLIAVSAIGIDISDARFIKNGHTLIDGILKYRLTDGSFSHTEGGTSNKTATVQVFMALTAYRLSAEKGERLYDFHSGPLHTGENAQSTSAATENEPQTATVTEAATTSAAPEITTSSAEEERSVSADNSIFDYKVIAYIIIGAAAAGACIILFLLKKRRMSNFVAVIIVAASAVCFIFFTDFRSKEEYYSGDVPAKTDVIGNVTLSIRCDTIVGKDKNEYVPANGIILDTTDFAIEKGDTVFDILTEAARKYGIQIESRSGGYIAGINYLYEFDYGDLSGWIYHVNGDAPFMMCSEYELSDGDRIEWLYTCELGNDLM